MTVLDQDIPAEREMACHYNWVTASLFVIVFGAVLIMGLLALVTGPGLKLPLFGLFLTVVSGSILWILCSQLTIAKPVLTIDERGVWDRRISGAPLPWHAISRAYVQQLTLMYASASVRLELNDATCFVPPRRGFMRFLTYRAGTVPYLAISHLLLTAGADEISARIHSYHPGIEPHPQPLLDSAFVVSPTMADAYAGPAEGVSFFRRKKPVAMLLLPSMIAQLCAFGGVVYSRFLKIESAALLIVFTLFTIWLVRELLTTRPVLALSREAVLLRGFGSRSIAWKDVGEVKVSDLLVAVEAPPLPEAPPWSPIRRILSAFRSDGPPMVLTFGLTAKLDEIRAAVAHFRAQASEESSSRR